jgi:chemotaxis protein CheC
MSFNTDSMSFVDEQEAAVFGGSYSGVTHVEELLGGNRGLLNVGKSGANSAATALSDVLMEEITIDVSDVHIVPSDSVREMYENTDRDVIVSLMELEGEAGCDVLLALVESEAKEIAAVMAFLDSSDELDKETQDGALTELGNIVIGCFISSLADSVGVSMLPTPPELIYEKFDAVLDRFIVKRTQNDDFSVIFKTLFKRGEKAVDGALVVFVSKELIGVLSNACSSANFPES